MYKDRPLSCITSPSRYKPQKVNSTVATKSEYHGKVFSGEEEGGEWRERYRE